MEDKEIRKIALLMTIHAVSIKRPRIEPNQVLKLSENKTGERISKTVYGARSGDCTFIAEVWADGVTVIKFF